MHLRVLHTVADLHPHSGGTSRVVVDLNLALTGIRALECSLISQGYTGASVLESSSSDARAQTEVASSSSRVALTFGLPFRRAFCDRLERDLPSLVHSHGLWLPVNHWSARYARKCRVPYIVQPHGMLETWALRHRAYKKKLAMALFQRKDLLNADLLVATAVAEYQSIRSLGLRQPVALIPNGLDMDVFSQGSVSPKPHHNVRRTVLFLSRVHPKKGLFNLIHAWAALPPGPWQLRIAGPDEGGHLAEVKILADRLGVGHSIEYLGPLAGDQKLRAYQGADLFVLPTFSENFGVVVAEALACGLPVITTRGAPWADLVTHGCGWWVDMGVEPLLEALRAALTIDASELAAMGARGQAYVRRYDWQVIAPQMVEVYRWMLGQGPLPACVLID